MFCDGVFVLGTGLWASFALNGVIVMELGCRFYWFVDA